MEESGDLVSDEPVVVEKRIRAGEEVLVATIREAPSTEVDQSPEDVVGEWTAGHLPDYIGPRFDVTFEQEAADESTVRL
jgi:hypothetical protein